MFITFLGGVGTVTGSKYLLESGGSRLLVDCGLFQGVKQLRKRNRAPLPISPAEIDHVVLTHAHLDHSGYVPLLVRNGYRGRIHCTEATRELCTLLLPDSGHLHELDAEFANRHGFSRHKPALPLYTRRDAEQCLDAFTGVDFDQSIELGAFSVRFRHAGHILGAAILEIRVEGLKLVFSGDLGRPDSPTTPDPQPIDDADYLVVESTYGDRLHDRADPEDALAAVIAETANRGGSVIIPSFAVGRAQTLLYHLWRLRSSGRIPELPIFLDSPMAINASDIYHRHLAHHRMTAEAVEGAFNVATYVREAEGSKKLDASSMPKIIITASGMATGGRVLHHLKRYAPDPRSTILFAGFQAPGTRGAAMVAGAERVRIHGQDVTIKATVRNLEMLSAHADADEIMGWLGRLKRPPRCTFVTHGEPAASDALRFRIQDELGWSVDVPAYRDHNELT